MTMFNTGIDTPIVPVSTQAMKRAADLINAGERDAAVPILRDLLKLDPRNVAVLRMLGNALSQNIKMASRGTEPECYRLLRLAQQVAPNDIDALCDYAICCRSVNKLREAHQTLDKALRIVPHQPRATLIKSGLLEGSNRIDEAKSLVLSALEHNPSAILAIGFAQLCLNTKEYARGIDAVRPFIDQVDLEPLRRTDMFFVLGHLYDKLGDYDDAFRCIQTANTMQGVKPASDFDTPINRWTREFTESIPLATVDTSRAVLVIGMPRSGTTLTEMILAAHPKIDGVGESPLVNRLAFRNPFEELGDQKLINAYAKEYTDMLATDSRDASALRVVDKMPENFSYLGLISRMLPHAKIIHCRRDARDVCLSIFFQAFGPWMKYARSLETIGEQYLGYIRLMEHWRQTLDIKIHDSVYEDLTADPEPNIRAMIDHVGMPFDEACLEPHKAKKAVQTASIAQVRNPIYRSSTHRWKHYEKHIGPLLEMLEGV